MFKMAKNNGPRDTWNVEEINVIYFAALFLQSEGRFPNGRVILATDNGKPF